MLAALHRAGEASTRQLGDAVPALRQPMELSPGKPYATTQQAHVRIMLHLGFEGVVVRGRPMGSWINSQYRWAAMDDWVPGGIAGMDPREASAQLVRRWLYAFGPGTTADVQWWTGWTVRDTRRALDDAGAVSVAMESADGDIDAWLAPDDLDAVRGPSRWVALLPGLDPTTMGWKDRRWYLDDAVGSHIVDRNGNAGPTIWVDGRIVGSWVQRKDGTIALGWLADVPPARRAQVEANARLLEDELGDTRFTVRFPAPIQAELLSVLIRSRAPRPRSAGVRRWVEHSTEAGSDRREEPGGHDDEGHSHRGAAWCHPAMTSRRGTAARRPRSGPLPRSDRTVRVCDPRARRPYQGEQRECTPSPSARAPSAATATARSPPISPLGAATFTRPDGSGWVVRRHDRPRPAVRRGVEAHPAGLHRGLEVGAE